MTGGAAALAQGGEGQMQRVRLRARGFMEEVSFNLVYGGSLTPMPRYLG